MPPLCTAGYGLASGQLNYFFGAFYLFTINTVFIAISSVVISQILKFPILTIVDSRQKKKVNRWISIIITLVLLPSIYFGYNLVKQERFKSNATRFINDVSVIDGHYLLKSEIRPIRKTIVLVYTGISLNEDQKKSMVEKAETFSLKGVKIEFPQGQSASEIGREKTENEKIKTEMNRLSILLKEKEKKVDSINNINYRGQQILGEIKSLYPEIINCSYSESYLFGDSTSNPEKVVIVVFTTKGAVLRSGEKVKIENWLKTRIKSDRIKVFYEK